jgi:phosphotransferase system  glucose/maltose/N-acetylglucosamine-specific IIC component
MKSKLNVYRKVFRFMVFTLTILTANLLSDFLSNYLVSFKHRYPPVLFTLMAMTIIVIIFYPTIQILDHWIGKFSKNVVETGKSLAGKYMGLLLAFLIALLILTYCYLQVWYDINIFDYLFMGKIKQLF